MKDISSFVIKALFLISIILVNSCCGSRKSPASYYEKDGMQFVEIVDTIYTKEVISDTIWKIQEGNTKVDTFVMMKEKLKVKLITFHDTITNDRIINVEGKCDPDTVVKTINVPLPPSKRILGLPEESFYTMCILFGIMLVPITILIILLKKVN